MPYNLQTSVGNVSVVDGTLNTSSTSLALPGRNYSGYGAPVVQNWLSLLEHFASSGATGPSNAIPGQLWYDKNTQQLKLYKNDRTTVTLQQSGAAARFTVGTFDDIVTGNLTVTGISTLGPAGNVRIDGGTSGQVLSTNGAGSLSWVNQTTGGGGGGTVNTVTAGTGINVSGTATDRVVTNIGVTSLTVSGTGIGISQSGSTGAVTLNLTNTGGGGATANGVSVYTATVYSTGTDDGGIPPPPTTGTGSFTFLPAPSQLTVPSGSGGATWVAIPPTSVNTNVYVSTTTFSTDTPLLTEPAGSWSNPVLAFNTSGGLPGVSTYTAAVYVRKTSQPSSDLADGKWNFTVGVAGSTLPTSSSSWAWTPPADNPSDPNDKLYVAYATASTNTPQIPAIFGPWSTPVEIVSVGAQGAKGERGFIPLAFVVTLSDPSAFSDANLTAAFATSRTGTPPGTNNVPIGMGVPPIPGDAAQFYWAGPTGNGIGGVTIVRQYQANGSWANVYNTVLSGNVVAPGSITANRLNANDVYALIVRGGTVPLGGTSGTGFWISGANGASYFGGDSTFAGTVSAGNVVSSGMSITSPSGAGFALRGDTGDAYFGANATIKGNVIGGSATLGTTSGSGFWLRGSDGAAYFGSSVTIKGNITGSTGTFSGSLSGANISGATGTFSGALSAASGTFSGALTAASGTFSGALTAQAINAVNTINIAGRAVTIPVSLTGTESVTIDVPDCVAGQPVLLTAFLGSSGEFAYESINGSTSASIRLTSTGAVLSSVSSFGTGTGTDGNGGPERLEYPPMALAAEYIPPSDGTIRFTASGGATSGASITFTALQVKR